MSNITFTKAINVNNDGVRLFEHGQFEAAKEQFELSLSKMREAVLQANKEAQPLKRKTRNSALASYGSSSSIGLFHWSETPSHTTNQYDVDAPGSKKAAAPYAAAMYNDLTASFIFRRVVIISPPVGRCTPDQHAEEISAVLFNLALSYHLIAVSTPNAESSMLKRAIQFYRISHSVHAHRRKSKKDCCSSSNSMIVAILNNLGQLHFDRLLEYEIAGSFFRQLLMRLRNKNECDGTIGFETTDFRGFMLNAMLEPPQLSAAA